MVSNLVLDYPLGHNEINSLWEALQNYPETAFEIQVMGGGVLLTFARSGASHPEESGATPQKSSEKILVLLRQSPTMTTKKLAQQLGISQRAIEKQIDKLKRDGHLQRIGPDKGGYWQVRNSSL